MGGVGFSPARSIWSVPATFPSQGPATQRGESDTVRRVRTSGPSALKGHSRTSVPWPAGGLEASAPTTGSASHGSSPGVGGSAKPQAGSRKAADPALSRALSRWTDFHARLPSGGRQGEGANLIGCLITNSTRQRRSGCRRRRRPDPADVSALSMQSTLWPSGGTLIVPPPWQRLRVTGPSDGHRSRPL